VTRNYAKISTSIWGSAKFKSLGADDRAKLLYLHLHSCKSVNSIGCFRVPLGYITADMKWSEATVKKAIDSLSKVELIEHNPVEDVVRIIDFIFHDMPTNPKHGLAILRVAKMVPDCAQKRRAMEDLGAAIDAAGFSGTDNLKAAIRLEIDRLSVGYPALKSESPPLSLFPVPLSPTHTQTQDSCTGPSALVPADAEDPLLITFPTNRFNTTGEVFEVRQSLFAQMAELYPGIENIAQQFRSMAGWLLANEKKRKTLKGMKTFINSWLSREHNRGGQNGQNNRPSKNNNWITGAAQLAAELREQRGTAGGDGATVINPD